jgi:tetratricopeptide (TPR) repeat protein
MTVVRHLLTATGLALTMLLSSSAATADDSKAEADTRFKEGLALAKQGKYVEARAKYLQAYALDERPSLLLSLAIVEHGAQRYLEALEHLHRYLDSPRTTKEKQHDGELRDTLWKQLWAQTGHVRVAAPEGSSVRVDGKPAGRAPLADVLDVVPGSHVVA